MSPCSTTPTTTTTTTTTTLPTTTTPPPSTQSTSSLVPVDYTNTLIGGIVGGAIGLLLIGALIAVCVVRSRRQPNDSNASALHSVHSTTTPQSNYGRVPPAQSNYSERALAADTRSSNYGILNANEVAPAHNRHYDVLNANEL
jgi:hypothetical protein